MEPIFAQSGDRCGWPGIILFDLDGTLVESAPDLMTGVNAVLASQGLAALTIAEVRSFIGDGVRKLVERGFAARGRTVEGVELDGLTERMMEAYTACLTDETHPMTGAAEMVAAYHKARVKIAVVTNKPESLSRIILDRLGLAPHVDIVVGGDTGPARKPAPDMLLHALKEAGMTVSRALMVGDSPADIAAARAAGMASIAVRGGYTSLPVGELGANRIIDTLNGLPSAIESLKEPA